LSWRIIDDGEEFIERCVREGGWAVNCVPGGDAPEKPAFAYTVGLFKNFKHAELIVFGQPREVRHHSLLCAAAQWKPMSRGDCSRRSCGGGFSNVTTSAASSVERTRPQTGMSGWT
jgi:hypothetical protein